MKIAVRRILMLSALMSPTALFALGLGDIRLRSALNQPFDADIQLVDATAEDLAALRAAVASNDTFARYGLERPAFLSEFTFAVDRNSAGQEVLRVTSPRPVTEPFVTFLVDATWPRGRLLREYTVLLDPPIYAPAPATAAAPVAAPRATTPAPRPAPAETYSPPAEESTVHTGGAAARAIDRGGLDVSGATERHALADCGQRLSWPASRREPGDAGDLPGEPAGIRRQHQRAALGQPAFHPGRLDDRADLRK